jgi:hypothetical protein
MKKIILAFMMCFVFGFVNAFAESCESAQEECNAKREACDERREVCGDVDEKTRSLWDQCSAGDETACYEARQYSASIDYICGLAIDPCHEASMACQRARDICNRDRHGL